MSESRDTQSITADTIRLQAMTIEQHEQTIRDLRAKMEEKGISASYALPVGVNRASELCYSVEKVIGDVVENTTIQGDPAAVKDLVQTIRAEVGVSARDVSVQVPAFSLVNNSDPRLAEVLKTVTKEGACQAYEDIQNNKPGNGAR